MWSCSSWLFGQTVVSDSVSSPPVSDVEEAEGLPSLDKPGWYSQGNWPHLHELLKTMTGKPEPKVGRHLVPYITGVSSSRTSG